MLLLRRASRHALAQRRALSAAPITSAEPAVKPARPEFSSGPCAKRPGWSPAVYESAATGRSHRSAIGKAKLKEAIETTREVLNIPSDYKIAVVPASDTGAIEMAMWSMLGERPVDMCHWESARKGWLGDVTPQLKLDNVTEITAGYGELPDLSQTNKDHDVVFTFNGTTSGVRVPNLDWIADDRTGLTFNDATSAVFAMDIDWSKVDVTTYSWQKVMGGEGAHGMLILSPRAVERLESFTPSNRPLPKIFRMTKKGKLDEALFTGATINTPSMVCVEDYLDALQWAQAQGGLNGSSSAPRRTWRRSRSGSIAQNGPTSWRRTSTRSSTSVCLTLDTDPANVKAMVKMLEEADVAYDIGAYRDAPAGLRIWCGATVNTEDLEALFPWIEYAFAECS